MQIQSNGAIMGYLSLAATAIAAGIRTAVAKHALGMFATLEIKNGARIIYGNQDQIRNTAQGAAT